MDLEAFQDALKDFMATSQTGCPWLGTNTPPTSSEIAFAWPSPSEPSGRKKTHCSEDKLDYMTLFHLFDMDGDGLVNIIDFQLLKVIWGVQIAEVNADDKREINRMDFINLLSSLTFKVGEPLCHTAVYRLVNFHPCKETLLQAHVEKLIAKIRKNHWGKVNSLLNEDKIKDLWMIFSLFDMNGDGRLTTYDFETLMLIWGMCPTDAAEILDKFDEVDGAFDFWAFINLVHVLDIQIGEPLYHFAIFSLVQYHLQAAVMSDAELWNLSAKFRRNLCGREEHFLMEYRFRSCKMIFSLIDADGDGHITYDDFQTLLSTWKLGYSPFPNQTNKIFDFESFFQVFSSINMKSAYGNKAGLNLLKYHERKGLLPQAAICHFQHCLKKKSHTEMEAEEECYKRSLRKTLELNRIFSLLDRDEDDHLSTNEVETLTRACQLSLIEIRDIKEKIEAIWGGRIDFESLLKLFNPSTMNPYRITESPSELFKILDKDGDGFLSTADFKRFASITGQEFTDQDIQGLMHKLDTEGNGEVSFDDFCRAMQEAMPVPGMLDMDLDCHPTREIVLTSLWEIGN